MPKFAVTFLPLILLASAALAQTPVAPTLTFPSDKAINVSTATSLKWHKTADATGYAVQLSIDANFTALLLDDSALTDTLDHVSHLGDTTMYYWRVRALGAGGFGPYSKTHSFTTTPPLDFGPTVVSPEDGSTVPTAATTLTWNTLAGAKTYTVQISDAYNFATLLVNETAVADTTFTPKGLAQGTVYYWHVRGNTTPVYSAWTKGYFSTDGASALAATAKVRSSDFKVWPAGKDLAVAFTLEKPARVRLMAFRMGGQAQVLAESDLAAGPHRMANLALPRGAWWIRMEADQIVRTQGIFLP